jgi:tRNA (guanine-N7-)-methyltransferase
MRAPDVNPHLAGHKAWGRPLIPADEAWTHRGRWDEEFGRSAPLHVEIGSGNGFFLRDLSLRHPDWDVVGIEIRYKRTVLCAKKLKAAGVANARILRYHAAFLDDLFEDGSLSGLYVNHPDPWPKERHEKNRLISRWFLEDVVRFLKPGAWLRLKSDHRPNVDRVLELLDRDAEGQPLPRLPLEVVGVSHDVERDGAPWPDDIKTNYQRKFIERGLPVHAIEVRRTDAPWPQPT